jgi:hypothetical protein
MRSDCLSLINGIRAKVFNPPLEALYFFEDKLRRADDNIRASRKPLSEVVQTESQKNTKKAEKKKRQRESKKNKKNIEQNVTTTGTTSCSIESNPHSSPSSSPSSPPSEMAIELSQHSASSGESCESIHGTESEQPETTSSLLTEQSDMRCMNNSSLLTVNAEGGEGENSSKLSKKAQKKKEQKARKRLNKAKEQTEVDSPVDESSSTNNPMSPQSPQSPDEANKDHNGMDTTVELNTPAMATLSTLEKLKEQVKLYCDFPFRPKNVSKNHHLIGTNT